MTTALTMVTDAFRLSNIIDENATPSAEQGEQGLRSLNQMMNRWDRAGIRLGWATVAALADTIPLDAQDEQDVKYNLSVRLCGEYGIEPLPFVADEARKGYATISKAHRQTVESQLDHLPVASGYTSGSRSIETG